MDSTEVSARLDGIRRRAQDAKAFADSNNPSLRYRWQVYARDVTFLLEETERLQRELEAVRFRYLGPPPN